MSHIRSVIVIVIVAFIMPAALRAIENPFKGLAKYASGRVTGLENVHRTLSDLRGDTITMCFGESVNGLHNFTKNVPDTVWIKKRPKKNPQLDKHYILNYSYRSLPDASGVGYYTPVDSVNGRQFAVAAVELERPDAFGNRSGIMLRMVDLDSYEMVNCFLAESLDMSLTIRSERVGRAIDALRGRKFYYKGRQGAARPDAVTVEDGTFTIVLPDGSRSLRQAISFTFRTDSGDALTYTPSLLDGDSFMSRDEFVDRYGQRIITSQVDSAIVNSPLEMPFSFSMIVGKVDGYSVPVAQTIDPMRLSGSSWGQATLPHDQVIFIGHPLEINGEKFYRAALNKKAFFIRARDVSLVGDDAQSCLDSLGRASDAVKRKFFQRMLMLSDAPRFLAAKELSEALDRFVKGGLGILEWGVYDESEYTDGTSVSVKFYNPTKSMIKYITLRFQGYNAVDDPVGTVETRKCIGPIEPDETASYAFEYVWFTDIVEYARLKSVVVQYKNGTSCRITDIGSVMAPYDFDELVDKMNAADPVESLR